MLRIIARNQNYTTACVRDTAQGELRLVGETNELISVQQHKALLGSWEMFIECEDVENWDAVMPRLVQLKKRRLAVL